MLGNMLGSLPVAGLPPLTNLVQGCRWPAADGGALFTSSAHGMPREPAVPSVSPTSCRWSARCSTSLALNSLLPVGNLLTLLPAI